MAGTNHFSRMNYNVTRGLRELLSQRSLSQSEWQEITEFFDGKCAFCGAVDTGNPRTGIVPDHLFPAVENGELCLGNIVPSCQDCNDHRGSKDWREYLNTQFPAEAQARINKIEKYRQTHPYTVPDDPYHSLTAEEKEEYENILREWHALWDRARSLRDKIKERAIDEHLS